MFVRKASFNQLQNEVANRGIEVARSHCSLKERLYDTELRLANLEQRYLTLLDHFNLQVVYPNNKPYLKEKE